MQNVKILKRSGPIPPASGGGSVEHKTLLRRPDTESPRSSSTVPPPKPVELKDVPAEYQELLSSMSSLAAEAGAEMESQMYALVEAEQSRLDESYSEMQKNLLRSMSSTINEYLPEVIKAKIAEEIAKVAEDVSATLNKSIRESTESSFQTAIEAAVASTKEEVSGATAEALQKVATSAKVFQATRSQLPSKFSANGFKSISCWSRCAKLSARLSSRFFFQVLKIPQDLSFRAFQWRLEMKLSRK
mmetsp:Transcript_35807/g.143098  ORF Transcript_35807/g.143098 Transcript_35807/m.143098 type:complete len:245 (-) Transcript_35807:1089-1823(-)